MNHKRRCKASQLSKIDPDPIITGYSNFEKEISIDTYNDLDDEIKKTFIALPIRTSKK